MQVNTEFMINHFENTGKLYSLFIENCFALLQERKTINDFVRTLIVQCRLSITQEYSHESLEFDYKRLELTHYLLTRFHNEFMSEYLPNQIAKLQNNVQ